MNSKDLRKLLEESNDKFSIFANRDTLVKYELKIIELVELINDFLDDEQKKKLFNIEHFKNSSTTIRSSIIRDIKDINIKLELLENADAVSNFNYFDISPIIDSMEQEYKIKMLYNKEFLQKYGIDKFEIFGIINSLDEQNIQKILVNREFVEENLYKMYIPDFISKLESEKLKLELIQQYNIEGHDQVQVLKTFSDKSKIQMVLADEYEFSKRNKIEIIQTFNVDELKNFLNNNKEFLTQNDISVYEITKNLSKDNQLDFVAKIETMDLTLNEKREILATLREDTKENIDKSILSQEYITAIEMKIGNDIKEGNAFGKVIIDFSKDLEIYRGLDKIISINPMRITDRSKINELCEICPRMIICDDLDLKPSTVEEYKSGEKWIEKVLQGIDEKWNDIQKVAYIDNAIGKKISYSPDFDTEAFDIGDARALWKIIDSGYGVCNGISQVEKYIFDRVGIESEMISSGNHAFLKLKNIELPNIDGTKSVGDTILDPTWNLASHRYNALPNLFCKSYEEIRKQDIRSDGTDANCHKNDEELSNVTLELDEQSLRAIYTSIGLADEEGSFPIKDLMDKSKMIDNYHLPQEESVKKQLELLEEYYPEFATCQNSTIDVLKDVILNQENLKFNKCVVNRVYEREDENKRAVLYVYIDLPEVGKKFYIADKEKGKFLDIPQKEFEEKFECYERDIGKLQGHRPWEDVEVKKELEDLTQSSGRVVASEGDER